MEDHLGPRPGEHIVSANGAARGPDRRSLYRRLVQRPDVIVTR
jgi:hypothetical protein